MRGWVCLGLALLAISGCGKAETGEARIGREFAQALLKSNWSQAQGLTSSHWQAKRSEAGTRALFEAMLSDVAKAHDGTFHPKEISIQMGKLPANSIEAREQFGVTTDAPVQVWKAWIVVRLRDPNGGATATMPMLIVRESGEAKIGFVAFRPGKE